jgi:hypothetical protein
VVQETGFVVALLRMAVFHATNIHLISLPPQQSCGAMVLVYPIPPPRVFPVHSGSEERFEA